MAKSREIPAQDPLNESETDESEEEVDGAETEVSESEPETEPVVKAPAAAKKAASSSSSSEESGSESDSEPDSSPTTDKAPPSSNVKAPPSSSAATKKAPAKAATSSPTTTTGGTKRLATPSLTQGAEKKRLKKASATKEGKKLCERVFTPKDEVLLLEAYLKRCPSPQMDELYAAVEGEVSVSVTKAQVQDKIRKLKKKYKNNKGKSAEKRSSMGENEMMVYQLSDKIWGNEEGPKSVVNKDKRATRIALRFEEAMGKDEKAMGKDEKAMGNDEKKKDASYAFNGRSVGEWIFAEGTGLLDENARSQLEKQWKKIRKEEVQLSVERFELSLQHAKMVYDSMSP